MLFFPHAKINLGLNVLRKRTDGYHDIESVLVPIPLHDVLEAIIDPVLKKNDIVFTRTGIPVPGDPDQDLCMKAARLIQRERDLPGIRLHLHKVIPIGAGLGGGSSDGAHTFLLLNLLSPQGLRQSAQGHRHPAESAQLQDMATELGSDCPFFLSKQPQFADGRGERLHPIELSLKGYWLLLVYPGLHVSTAEVYANTVPTETPASWLDALVSTPPRDWKAVTNTMEEYVFRLHPSIADIKQLLLHHGADHAAMSGSGSSVFGLFNSEPQIPIFPRDYKVWKLHM